MGNRRTYLISQIVKYSQLTYQKGFAANHDGNITAKLDDVLLATPTAVSKGDIEPEMIITLDSQGKKLEGLGNPFSEIKLHLAAYRAREETQAVVHAHPPFSTARGLVGLPLIPTLPEAVVSIGDYIPVAEFAMPGDARNDAILERLFMTTDVILLSGNGVLATGENVEQAYLRLELIEHLACIEFYAKQMGSPLELSEADKNKLLEKRAAIGLGPKKPKVDTTPINEDELVETIAKQVMDRLR